MRNPKPLAFLILALAAPVLVAGPAAAHHRQTPEVLALTTSGDADLPRVPPTGRKALSFAMPDGADTKIVVVKPFHDPGAQDVITQSGLNDNPAISFTGTALAWDTDDDPLSLGLPGRQVVFERKGILLPAALDESGTSRNPAVDKAGIRVAFESTADLANSGNQGAQQVFVRQPSGVVIQASRGVGTSGNAVLSNRRRLLAFESTSHPQTGADTGVFQIWVGDGATGAAAPITDGDGSSREPAVSDDGNLLVFESEADLAGNGSDTGVPQIFVYHLKSETFARITNDAGGCHSGAAGSAGSDWRISFVCSGQPYYFELRSNERYRVEVAPGSNTQRLVTGLGKHFLLISTTANMLGTGTTAGHRLYMLNIFKQPGTPVAGSAVWFPHQGIPGL
jgi:Tol biopolymer transport system component